jgi:threonine-phosphate decarboxylase
LELPVTSAQAPHGGQFAAKARTLGIDPSQVLDFSVSCSPLGIPQKIIAAWPELLSEVKRYPSVEGSGVQHFYAARYGIDPDRLIAGNGSIDCIYALADLLRPTRATVLAPCFADYRRSLEGRGTQVVAHILRAEDAWILSSDDRPNPGQLVWLASPGNPTAAQWPQERILKLAHNLAKRGAILVLDEAFIDLVPDARDRSLLWQKNLGRLLVTMQLVQHP